MRYESKHSYFKKLAQSIGNFTNVEITLAKRHQYLQCYQHLNTATLLQENTEVGPGKQHAHSYMHELLYIYSLTIFCIKN